MSAIVSRDSVRVAIGPDADRLLADASFMATWAALFAACPWATSAQAPGFVRAWRDAYRHVGDLVLAYAPEADGTLGGLVALVRLGRSRRLTHAGLGQAEYHGWICTPDAARSFPPAAFAQVQAALPGAIVRFGYLAPGTPLAWLDDGPHRQHTLATTHTRPTIDTTDGAAVTEWRRIRKSRDRLKQFERLGPLTLKRITDAAEYDALLERIIPWCDIRQASVHGRAPFRSDASKAPFYRALFRDPGLLHATALHVGDRLVAVNLGGCSADEVQLGVIAHDPLMARHSPGTFLIRLLPELLHAEGHARLDLTAGGDTYKDRFATATDTLVSLEIHATGWSARMARARRAAIDFVEQRLARRGITRRRVKLALMQLREARPADLSAWVRASRDRHAPATTTLFTLETDRPATATPAPPPATAWNDIDALLAFSGTRPGMSRQAFLSTALRRLESGHQVCTWREDGRLLGVAWLVPALTDAVRASSFPALPQSCVGGALVHDAFVDPRVRNRGIGTALLCMAIARAGTSTTSVHATAEGVTPRVGAWLGRAGFMPTGAFPHAAAHTATETTPAPAQRSSA